MNNDTVAKSEALIPQSTNRKESAFKQKEKSEKSSSDEESEGN